MFPGPWPVSPDGPESLVLRVTHTQSEQGGRPGASPETRKCPEWPCAGGGACRRPGGPRRAPGRGACWHSGSAGWATRFSVLPAGFGALALRASEQRPAGHHAQRRALPPELLQGERKRPRPSGGCRSASGRGWGEPECSAARWANCWASGGWGHLTTHSFPTCRPGDSECGLPKLREGEVRHRRLPRTSLFQGGRPPDARPRRHLLALRRQGAEQPRPVQDRQF